MRMLHGLARRDADRIVEARSGCAFASMDDLARRTRLARPVLTRLAKAGAFGSLEMNHRESFWQALAQDQRAMPLFNQPDEPEPETTLPKMSAAEEVLADYRTSGLSLRRHPMSFLREGLRRENVAAAEQLKVLPNDRPVRVAGIVLVRQRPGTAKGITFVTLEDETGTANLIIRPNVWKRHRGVALGATVLLAQGRLQRQDNVIHVLVTHLENLSGRLQDLSVQSRDFC
ncbi:MAG: OB-fold nucleic acid binding domain-containing protein [Planctomycetia bacterium]|nr:OB-fold nucleic acid binding domain-containing protein [Planctomycetia bacterium]